MQLDHIFICVSSGAPEAERLRELGLTEGPPNTHPGQGTACRRFFFNNMYLELLWVENEAEARSEAVRETFLWERWSGRQSGGCPFGFVFRPGPDDQRRSPFATWEYHPPYLPPDVAIGVGTNAGALTEPALFWLGFAKQGTSRGTFSAPEHCNGVREVTQVEFVSPHLGHPSRQLKLIADEGLVTLRAGTEYRIELSFDGLQRGEQADLRPVLPLILRW